MALLIVLALIMGCAGTPPGPATREHVFPTATLQPTPTLAGGPAISDSPPTPPVTRPAEQPAGVTPPAIIALTPSAEPATPTPIYTPTATPLPAVRLEAGQLYLEHGNTARAAEELAAGLMAVAAIDDEERRDALYDLALIYLKDGRTNEAVDTLNELLALATASQGSGDEAAWLPSAAYFLLGEAYRALGDCRLAAGAYSSHLEGDSDLAAYVYPRIAECHLALGDQTAAYSAYEAAVAAPAHREMMVFNRQKLAELVAADGRYTEAIAQYQAIHDVAQTERTRGWATYQMGHLAGLAGDTAASHDYYLAAVNNYPQAYESYLALLALVEAGVPVDDYQRGVVDFYAGAYQPAVEAFERTITAGAEDFRPDAYLFLAWSYEELGNAEAALATFDAYMATAPDDPAVINTTWLERAHLYRRAGQTQTAIDTYLAFVQQYPDYAEAGSAAWWAAVLTEQLDDEATAATRYRQMADAYPAHENAPEALYQAGLLAHLAGDAEGSADAWTQTVEAYPGHEYASAARIWLMKSLSIEAAALYREQAMRQREAYYPLRAHDVALDVEPFVPAESITIPEDDEGQEEAEAWLRTRLGLPADTDVSALLPALTQDRRLAAGTKLWQLGLPAEARRELEWLRASYADAILPSYQLALYFRDLGLYRSSIVAAASVLRLTGASVFDAPVFLARLAYPVYYADLIVPLAEQYGYDPLLQFALVRQESLFESFATSSAVAQGLSQVIPDTGAYIAQRLAWPDYQNEDLYRPYVGLAFGAYYLDEQLRAFDGNVYAALSAYNAGPGNAARWHNAAPDDLDLYFESVSFAETRLYIERIYVGQAIYRYLYGSET